MKAVILVVVCLMGPRLLAVSYPGGASASGVIDVTDLSPALLGEGLTNLDNTGTADNRAALQALVNRFRTQDDLNPSLHVRILYFPDGTYRLSGGITGVDRTPGGGGILLQGESRDGTLLKLDNNATGFGSAASPNKFISFFEDTWTNNAFFNGIEDLTLDTGSGNPGAIALAFYSNNTGYVRNVRLRSGTGGGQPGHIGLLTNTTIASTSPSGVGLIKDLIVEGFETGIHTGSALQQTYTFENIILSGQGVAGIQVNGQPAQFRNIQSTNTVPALRIDHAASHVVVLDSDFSGGSSAEAAIDLTAGHLFVRDSTRSGYGSIIDDVGSPITTDLSADEYLSAGSTVLKQWSGNPERTLDLPIVDTPEVPWDSDPADWAIVDPNLQDDDTAALFTALNSGARTICILPSENAVKVSATLTIGPNVRRILGQWNAIQPAGNLFHADPGAPIFRFADSNHPAVVIEKFRSDFLAGRKSYLVRHESAADLVLRDLFYVAGPLYRNQPGVAGRLFAEDVHCLPGSQNVAVQSQEIGLIVHRQTAYFRQFNPEQFSTALLNDGGTVWIMGFKVGETTGPVVRSINNATTEILGGVMNMTHDTAPADPSVTTILEIDHANVSAILLERFEGVGVSGGLGWGKNTWAVLETRGSETRSLANETAAGVPRRPHQLGAIFPLYVGYQFGATVVPAIETAQESAGTIDAFTVSRGSNDTSSPVTIGYTVSGTAVAGTNYQSLSGTLTIPAGAVEVPLPVTLIDDASDSVPLTLTITLQPGAGYDLGPAADGTLTIIDDDFVVAPGAQAVLPPGTTASATVTINNPTASAQTVAVTQPSDQNYDSYQVSGEPGGPAFEWIEISGTGSMVLTNADDGNATNRSIGFPFPFYGQEYTQVSINSNGFLFFDGLVNGDWTNRNFLTTNGTANVIAPLWDDHNPGAPNSDAVYHEQVDADTFVVQWNNLLPFRSDAEVNLVTFQAVLKRNGTIFFQYLQMNAEAEAYSYTIGMENADETQAVVVSHRQSLQPTVNPDFAQPLMAIRFNPLLSWLEVSAGSAFVAANGSSTVQIDFDTTGLDVGIYETTLRFTYPDPQIGEILLPVRLEVTADEVPVATDPAIIGTPAIGGTLTTDYSYSDPEGDPEGATLIEWLIAESASGPFAVAGTGGSYAVQSQDAGHWLQLRVTPVSTAVPTTGSPVTSAVLGPIPADSGVDALPTGLVAYWPFDDGLAPAADVSGNSHHAALQSGSSLTPFGRFGDALQINENGGARAGTAHLIDNDFTIAAWVYRDGAYTSSTNEFILGKGWDFYFAIETAAADGKLRMQFKHSGGTVSNAHLNDAKTRIPPDTWTHVAVTRAGGSFTFYLNGTEYGPDWVTAASTNAIDANGTALSLGHNPLNPATWWRGRLDEVQLYGRALAPYELAGLFARSTDPLLTWQAGVFADLPGGHTHEDAALEANPDGDVYSNFMEFAFGLNPREAEDTDRLPQPMVVSEEGESYLALQYVRRRGISSGTGETGIVVDGLEYRVKRTDSLMVAEWDNGNDVLLESSVEEELDGTETVIVRSRTPVSLQQKEFLALEILRR